MNLRDIIIVAIAMAMDAMTVSVSIGLNNKVSRSNKIAFIISFAVFQFLFFFMGGIGGHLFDKYVTSIPNMIGGIAIAIIGILMIIEGFTDKTKEEPLVYKKGIVLILGISVSIDALVVGFTGFNYISSITRITLDSLIVGIVTFLLCSVGFYLCKLIRKVKLISKYPEFVGGIMLIIFAIRMILY